MEISFYATEKKRETEWERNRGGETESVCFSIEDKGGSMNMYVLLLEHYKIPYHVLIHAAFNI